MDGASTVLIGFPILLLLLAEEYFPHAANNVLQTALKPDSPMQTTCSKYT
jgi:hypothetical protein